MCGWVCTTLLAPSLSGQQPLTRSEAIAAAEALGSRLALARADTTISAATLAQARMFENPTVSGSYRSRPLSTTHHSICPSIFLWLRGARAGSAAPALAAARFRFGFERAAARFDADTAYTRALAPRRTPGSHGGTRRTPIRCSGWPRCAETPETPATWTCSSRP